jgi:fibro-slime domain-containing protein
MVGAMSRRLEGVGRLGAAVAGLLGVACHGTPAAGPGGAGGSGGGGGGVSGSGGGGNGDGGPNFTFMVPEASAAGSDSTASEQCGALVATLRDFKDDHPDMEKAVGDRRGLVKVDLGADGKPVYAPPGPTAVTAGQASFDQWYRDVAGVNMKLSMPLPLQQTQPGVFGFASAAFFPLDGKGFGNQGRNHNFHFTTEIHATFTYRGGEKFTFTGDDDVFVFVNKKLALDLGGVHIAESATIDFDAQKAALGITVGGTYSFDAFHAERHTSQSNFRVESSIDCLRPIL